MAKFDVLAFGLAALVISGGPGIAASPSYGQGLGGVNLNYYCKTTFGAEFKSVLVGKTAGDWTCQRNNNDRRPISVNAACDLQYGKTGLRAKALNWNDPLSWRCFQVGHPR
jgi:hypothetical protein